MSVPLLQGVRVLDLTNVLAGPFAGYQLALLGADVLKVESPHGGDLARQLGADPDLSSEQLGASFLAQNAGKRSIALDLKDEGDRATFTRLIADYDVVLENFRPGVLDRLGFGWDAIRDINPSAIYCAVSGFGQTGPMRERPAYDQIIQGLSGLMSVTGTAEGAPIRVGVPICDSIGGLVAAFAICAALVRRGDTGEGALLDVSMLEAAITSMGWVVSDQLIAQRDPRPMGNENPTSAPSGTFDTADGKLNIAANKQEQFEALCGVLRRQDLLADARFATRDSRKRHRDELREELEKSLTQQTAREWDAQLTRIGVPAAPVVTVREALESEHIRARGLIHTVASPAARGGTLRLLGSPVRVDGEAIGPAAPPPVLGADNAAVLAELERDTRKGVPMTTTIPPIASFDRCQPELLARLARFGTSMVSDAMERFGALDSEIQPQWPTARLVGSAFTVWTRSGDNLAIHEALDVVGPGDVLVVNGSGDKSRALIGEMIGIKAKARGVAGFVLDGAARDIEALQDLDMPVFARACTPAGPYKHGPFRLLQPIAVGGVCVSPGDAVLADRDGVTIVGRRALAETIEKATRIEEQEGVKRVANAKPIR